ncbi:MAG: DnaJ C-terminal domain-containing protein [Kiritimatiellia bacterium]
MNGVEDYYQLLGVDRDCSLEDIRQAYRTLAKQFHPDVSDDAERMRDINEAYAVLKDPELRRAHDETLGIGRSPATGSARPPLIKEDSLVTMQELFRGTNLQITVRDPANPAGPEVYDVAVPPGTAPGAKFTIKRDPPFERGSLQVRIKLRPDFRFRARGSDLRCDLNIRSDKAERGGTEMLRGPQGGMITVKIPPRVARHEIIRVPGQGLPKPRGGRGDLLVRIQYRVETRTSRGAKPGSSERRRLRG